MLNASDWEYIDAMTPPPTPGPVDTQSLLARSAGHIVNLPKNTVESLRDTGLGVSDWLSNKPPIMREDEAQQRAATDPDFMYRSMHIAPPNGIASTAIDVLGKGILPELPWLMLPAGAVGRGARFLASGAEFGTAAEAANYATKIANRSDILGGMATGALAGNRDGGNEAAIQAGEFGLMDAAGTLFPSTRPFARAVAQGVAGGGIGLADQAARGNNPFTEQGLTQAGIMAALPMAMEGGRRMFEKTPPTNITTPPAPGAPGWNLLHVTETPEGRFLHEFDTPNGPQSFEMDSPMRPPDVSRKSSSIVDPSLASNVELQTAPPDTSQQPSIFRGIRQEQQPEPVVPETPPAPEPTGGTLKDAVNNRSVVNYQGDRGKLRVGDDGLYFRKLQSNEEQRIFGLVPDANVSDVEGLTMERQGQQRPSVEPVEPPGPYNQQIVPQAVDPNAPRLLRPLVDRSRGGFINRQLLGTLGGGVIGAGVGYALPGTDEERRRHALLLGLAGAGIGAGAGLLRKLGGAEGEAAARRRLTGIGNTPINPLGAMRRFGEKYMKAGQSPALDTAKEMARGLPTTIQGDFNAILQNALPHLASLDTPQRDALKTYMSSDRTPAAEAYLTAANLPKPVHDFAVQSGTHKAELQKIVADAQSDPQKQKLIQSTLGTYVTEPYRAFVNQKEWLKAGGVSAALRDQIVQENMKLPQYAGFTEDKIRADVDSWIQDVHNFDGNFDRMANEGQSRMSKSLFTARKQLRPSVQDALGRITDPVERETLTIAKLTSAAHTAKLVTELQQPHAVDLKGRRLALPTADWEANLAAARAKGDVEEENFLKSNYEPMPDTMPGLGSLSQRPGGMMAQRQVMDALQIGKGHQFGKVANYLLHDSIMAMANRIPKASHTILNPATHIHNIAQTLLMVVSAGMHPVSFVSNLWKLHSDPQRLRWAKEDGILEAHVGAQEFRRAADNFTSILTPKTWANLPKRAVGSTWAMLKSFYGAPVNWARGSSYVKFLDEGLASGKTTNEARRYAVEMTNRYTHNYANVAPAVGILRNTPLVNPFLSYTAEQARIIKNLAEDVWGNKNGRRWQSAAALTTFLGLGAGITALIQGSHMSDEDKQKLAQLIPLLPPYMHGRTQAQVGRDPKTGVTSLLNLNPWIPGEDFLTTAKNIYNGDWDAVEGTNPVVGLDRTPLWNVFSETKSGKDAMTGQPTTFLQSVRQNFLPGWVPGNYNYEKVKKGFTRNEEGGLGITDSSGRKETPTSSLLSLAGVSVAQESPRMLLMRQQQDREDAVKQAQSNLRRVLRTDTNDADKKEAEKEFVEARRRLFQR